MNYTADLLAEEIYKIEGVKSSVLRTISQLKEDIFCVVFSELKEYSLLYKMIFDVKAKNAYTKEITTINKESAWNCS